MGELTARKVKYALYQRNKLINSPTHHSTALFTLFIPLTEVIHTRPVRWQQLRWEEVQLHCHHCESSTSRDYGSGVEVAPQVCLSCSCMSLRSLHRFNQLPIRTPVPFHSSHFFRHQRHRNILLHSLLRAHYDVMCSIIFIFYSYLHFTTHNYRATQTGSCLFFYFNATFLLQLLRHLVLRLPLCIHIQIFFMYLSLSLLWLPLLCKYF